MFFLFCRLAVILYSDRFVSCPLFRGWHTCRRTPDDKNVSVRQPAGYYSFAQWHIIYDKYFVVTK